MRLNYNNIQAVSKVSLNGLQSHAKIISYPRMGVPEALKSTPAPKISAVLALLYPIDNAWHIILMKRNAYPGVHSGQISLPGGQVEVQDKDLTQTALRETQEEVGIDTTELTVIRTLSPLYIPPSHFVVHPFLAISETPLSFTPDPREVERLIALPLSFLIHDQAVTDEKVQLSDGKTTITTKAYRYDDEIIWGATAMILQEVSDLLKASKIITR